MLKYLKLFTKKRSGLKKIKKLLELFYANNENAKVKEHVFVKQIKIIERVYEFSLLEKICYLLEYAQFRKINVGESDYYVDYVKTIDHENKQIKINQNIFIIIDEQIIEAIYASVTAKSDLGVNLYYKEFTSVVSISIENFFKLLKEIEDVTEVLKCKQKWSDYDTF